MFDFEAKILSLHGKKLPIKQWTVWFMTPKGLATDLETAIDICAGNDWLPNAVIQPVPVAIDESGRYEIVLRSNS